MTLQMPKPATSIVAPAQPLAAPAPPAPKTIDIQKYMRDTGTDQKNMILIVGPPVSGKTRGARTFPNPIHVDIDHNLPPNTQNVVPLWDGKFIDTVKPRLNPAWHANRRDALDIILADFEQTLTAEHTLIIDSITRMEVYYNMQEDDEPKPISDKTGKVDGHALWAKRLRWFNRLCTRFQSCPATVIFIVHQQFERDEKGNLTSQLRPALQGQIGDQLPGYFPTCLFTVRDTDAQGNTTFKWRIRPNQFIPARVPKPADVEFIPQDYSILKKYL